MGALAQSAIVKIDAGKVEIQAPKSTGVKSIDVVFRLSANFLAPHELNFTVRKQLNS